MSKNVTADSLGCKKEGVEKGSPASKMQSSLGDVPSDSTFSAMQKAGATGDESGVSCNTGSSQDGSQNITCTKK